MQQTALTGRVSLWRGHQDIGCFTDIVGCLTVPNSFNGWPNLSAKEGGKPSKQGIGGPNGKVSEGLQYVDRSRSDCVFVYGPAGLGHQRRTCEKVSGNGHQGSSDPNGWNQTDWHREGTTRLLPRVRCQGRQDGKLIVLW